MNVAQPNSVSDPYRAALAAIWERSAYDRGFISNPFAGEDAARLGLRRTDALLEALGRPQARMPLIHVAGSKGKGSTAVMIDAMLRAAGMRSGRFTSPHLHSFRERSTVNDIPISEADFALLTRDVLRAAEAVESERPELGRVTSFELSTAMALAWLAQCGCDVGVIEVGLGGTLDATNVIDPAVAVISRLDIEHTAILGETLPEIAANKAGIVKPGRPAVTVTQLPEALEVIEHRALEVGSPLLVHGRDWSITGDEDGFAVSGPWGTIDRLRTSLVGAHQMENAGLAIAAIRTAVGIGKVDDDAIRRGLLDARHPGRFERLTLDGNVAVVLDGAHTPVAAEALAAALSRHLPGKRATFVVGMLREKPPEAFLAPLIAIARRWIVAMPATPRAMPANVLVQALQALGPRAEQTASVAEALRMATNADSGPVIVTGSLTTVAEARVALGLAVNDPTPAGVG